MKPMDRVCLVLLVLGLWLFLSALPKAIQPPMEGAWGYDVPPVVGMTGEQTHVVASCTLEAADHESGANGWIRKIDRAYAHCGTLTLSAPPASTPADALRGHLGAEIEVIFRRKAPRELLVMERKR